MTVSFTTQSGRQNSQTIAYSYDGFLTTRIAYSGIANGEYRYSIDNNFRVTSVGLDNVMDRVAKKWLVG